MERLEFTAVEEERWYLYRPMARKLTSFEIWAMNMCYECLFHEINKETKYEVNKGDTFFVKDDTFVYNSENMVFNKNGAKAWMYLTEEGYLMLEFRLKNGMIDELFVCM